MPRFSRSVFGVFLLVLIVSCSTPSRPGIDPIASSKIINSVKCGFAIALYKEQKPGVQKRLTGNVASLELQLKVTTADVNGVAVSGVIPFHGGPTILPSFSASRGTAWTVDSTINAAYKLDATNAAVCDAAGINLSDPDADPLGFSAWLGTILEDLSRVSLEKPTGTLNSLVYEAAFGVTEQSNASLGLQAPINLAFFTANVSAASTRNDLQRLKIVISGAPVPPKVASAPSTSSPNTPTPPVTGGNGNLGSLATDKGTQRFSTIVPLLE